MEFRTGALAIACVTLTAAVATAQINPFGKRAEGLDGTDMKLLMAAAAQLYKAPSPSVGASKEWSNADSGSVGTVSVVDVEGSCVQLLHRIKRRGEADPSNFVVIRCKVGDKWELRS